MNIIERIALTADMFSKFQNPSKETILTPWKVVNMQISSTLGGLRFVDNEGNWYGSDGKIHKSFDDFDFTSTDGLKPEPIWIEPSEDIENIWRDPNSTILDINSKTSLYPLLAAANLFYLRKKNIEESIKTQDTNLKKTVNEYAIWRYIVENQIFVNCRVPYSRKIAERVLAGYDEMKVNASVVDVMIVRNALKEFKLQKYRADGTLAKGLRSLTEDETNEIWKWIFNPTAMKTITEDGRTMTEVNAEKIIKLAEESNPEAAEKLLEEIMKSDKGEKYSFIASNPPYQENLTDNTSKAKPVWPDFIYVSSSIAKVGSFINPARWQRGGAGTGLLPIKNYFFTSKRLQKFITLPDHKVFPGVGIGNVCIELLNFEKEFEYPLSGIESEDGSIVYSEYTPNELIDIVLDEETEEVIVKILEAEMGPNFEKELWVGGMDTKTKRKATSAFGQNQLDYGLVGPRLHREPEYFILENEKVENVDYVKVYYSPKAKTVAERFLPRSEFQDISKNNERIPKWKVLIPKTNAHFFYRNLGPIAEPNSLCTNTWVCRSFDSKVECENFQSYLKTYFYRFLVCSRNVTHNATANVHRFVPDLAEVTNPRTGLVGYESDWTDEDLKILFEGVLTEEDWAYIEKTAIESDPAGAKK